MRSSGGNKASFQDVILSNATISGQIDMSGASFDGSLDGNSLQVGGSLFMRSDGENEASFKTVNLDYATVKRDLIIDGAIFGGEIVARGLHVTGDVSMRNVVTDAPLVMPQAQLGGNLDFGGANLAVVDLRSASIVGEMRLGDRSSMVGWLPPNGETDYIDLRNARVGSLSDNKYSWPRRLHLGGFTFSRLGGFDGDSEVEMLARGPRWWETWLRLDPSASYEQFAAAFAAFGYRNEADDIRYLNEVRTDEIDGGSIGRYVARYVGGYGIGSYAFRSVYWALILSLIGAGILRLRVPGVAAAGHGLVWCVGASLNRLLPVLNLKKEFADFFDNPGLNKFTRWQDLFFTFLGMFGWMVSAFVIAAMATITHGS
jgi:hypothetical protein